MFVSKLFVAGGSQFFSAATTADKDYQKKLYNRAKPLTQNLKGSFPKPINTEGVIAFFATQVEKSYVRDVMTAFAIPTTIDPDVDLLSKALTAQFQLLIQSDNCDVDDIVATEYQRLMTEPTIVLAQATTPIYPSDSVWVLECKPHRSYSADCYDKFTHEWVIRNNGSQTWRKRRLVFVSHFKVGPQVLPDCVELPDIAPGKDIKIATSVNAGGSEGHFELVWELQDSDGKDCFPNNKKQFYVSIDIKFEAK